MRIAFLLAAISFSSFTYVAFPHGMDKPGPHGGYIQMPGTFHTEVVPISESEWKIYLLDENLKNPMVKNSSVLATVEFNQKKVALTCKENGDYFACTLQNNSLNATPSKLQLEAKRGGGTMGISIYKLPLSFR